MTVFNHQRASALAASVLLAAAAPQLSYGRTLEEIVVSAQKTEQNLQDVPISMAVVGKEELAKLNIFDFAETAALTPGVDFTPGSQSAAIRLRGIGPGSFSLTSPQSVAVFVDEFSQIAVGVTFFTLVDVERIELLRGPQGTLYGLNAPGGVYNITTRAPNTEQVEGNLEFSYSQFDKDNLETTDVRGALNIPLIDDTLALRVAGVYAESDGAVRVVNPNAGEDSTGGKKHWSTRSRLRWFITPDMDLTWNVIYNDLDDNPAYFFNPQGLVPGTGEDTGVPAIINDAKDNLYYGDFVSSSVGDLFDTNLHFRRSMEPFDLDFLLSYQKSDSHLLDNREPYPGFNSLFDIRLESEQYTSELRITDTTDIVDYIAGVFYSERELVDGQFNLNVAGSTLTGPASGISISSAAFANLTFHLSEKWDVTVGARYEENTVETQSLFDFLGLQSEVDGELDFDHLSWSFKLRHYFNEDHTAYLAIDNAYKQGGFNNLVPGLETLVPFFPQIPELEEASVRMLAFDEEISTAIEIGAKGTVLDGNLRYNFAVFYQEFEDHQVTQAGAEALDTPLGDLNTLFLNQLVNVDEATTKGVEFEVALLFADYWDLSVRAAYFDPEIEEWSFRFCPRGEEESPNQLICPASGGQALNDLPNWNTNVQIGQARPLSPNWLFYGRLNWSWNSEQDTSDERIVYDPYSLVGLTLGFTNLNNGLDIRFWGKNITDNDNYNPQLKSGLDPSLEENSLEGQYRPGPEYGVTLSYSFGN